MPVALRSVAKLPQLLNGHSKTAKGNSVTTHES